MATVTPTSGKGGEAGGGAPSLLTTVRVEGEDSVGRAYSGLGTGSDCIVPGLGARRRTLTTRSWAPYADKAPVLESLTMAPVHLSSGTREGVLAYFRNTWALTDTLFSALKNDSVFYSVPDKLRRPLIFYFCHPAALYINQLHQAGLLGA